MPFYDDNLENSLLVTILYIAIWGCNLTVFRCNLQIFNIKNNVLLTIVLHLFNDSVVRLLLFR